MNNLISLINAELDIRIEKLKGFEHEALDKMDYSDASRYRARYTELESMKFFIEVHRNDFPLEAQNETTKSLRILRYKGNRQEEIQQGTE